MNYAMSYLLPTMLDLLRRLLWAVVTGFVMLGASYYGGMSVYDAWQKAGPPARRRRGDQTDICRTAERGIAEIEAFLAAEAAAPGRSDLPPTSGRRRNLPPGEVR